MLQKLIILFQATVLFACTVPMAQPKEFSQNQLQQDLAQVVNALKKYHPGLYWYQSGEEFDKQVELTAAAIENGQSMSEFYKSLNQLLSSIGCGHTRSRLPEERYTQLTDTTLVLPMPVFIKNREIYTTEEFDGIAAGSKIISVAGYKSKDIIDELRSVVPSDGYNTTGKDHFISQRFGLMLTLYMGVTGPSTSVEYSTPWRKSSQTKEIQLLPLNTNRLANPEPLMSLKNSGLPGTKILRIGSFSSGMLNRAGFSYFDFLESAFSQLKKESIANLIIDVRGNGGGNDHYGATLVSYIAEAPFRYFDKIEVTEAYDGYGQIEQGADGMRLMVSHQDLSEQQPASNRFTGNVFILTDGGSFSTAADFVSISKNIGAATVVGLETGGGAYGNTSGNNERVILSNTGIEVQIQLWRYFSAIRKDFPVGRGVLPDYEMVNLPYTDEDEVLELVSTLLSEDRSR